MYEVIYTGQFKKSLKLCVRRGLDIKNFTTVLDGCWECHITSDWLLIWQQDDKQLRLILVDTGSHSDLF